MLSTAEVLYVQCWQKNMWLLFLMHIQLFGFVKDNGMHALIHTCLQKRQDHPITINLHVPLYESLMCLEMDGRSKRPLPWTAIASHKLHTSKNDTIVSIHAPISK